MKPSHHNTPASTVIVPGNLTIREVSGRNGTFRVGKLITHIGEFAVKNPELDQYDPGSYAGNFCIDKIYPSYYLAGGKIIVEIRAVLSCFVLAGFDEATGEAEPLEIDPAEEEAATATPEPAKSQPETPAAEASTDADAPVPDNLPVMSLEQERAFREEQMDRDTFGELYPLGQEVKLDPTIARPKLRAQCDRLKTLGYRFVAARQVWARAA